jgi:hypothetical protein
MPRSCRATSRRGTAGDASELVHLELHGQGDARASFHALRLLAEKGLWVERRVEVFQVDALLTQ